MGFLDCDQRFLTNATVSKIAANQRVPNRRFADYLFDLPTSHGRK
jgi:hypothetical protein